MDSTWIKATTLDELKQKSRVLVRHEGKQIVLFHSDNAIHACNNRCPHEGYPLSEGQLSDSNPNNDCILTCHWHNWKFNLKDGSNLYGGDQLRIYPTEIKEDHVWIDLTEPPIEEQRERVLASLREAFNDNAYERMARELARLQHIGCDPIEGLINAIEWSYDRMEFGWTHAYAACADWLTLYDEFEDDSAKQMACILECVAHIADDVLRERRYPFAKKAETFSEDKFLSAIEQQDQKRTVALIRGALKAGMSFNDLEPVFARAALAHYNDFGHSLIYLTKARQLIERIGKRVTEPLLLSLARSYIFSVREDQIPEFSDYQKTLNDWHNAPESRVVPQMQEWRKLGISKSLALTASYAKTETQRLYLALLGANAWSLLAFDIHQQNKTEIPISDNIGWLSFTHGLTFANAVNKICSRYPELWPAGLLQMSCFCGRNAAFTEPQADFINWRVGGANHFYQAEIEKLFDHDCDEFIVSVHRLKTMLAAREESRNELPEDVARHLNASVNRYLNSPIKRKQVQRTVFQAMKFVARDG